MFNTSKYTNTYFNIINSRQDRVPDANSYYERHHIIPKSLGGSNKAQNLIYLTAREHFICHWLLTKMTTNEYTKQKMISAFFGMYGHRQNRKLTAKQYDIIKSQGRKQTPESNLKRSLKLKGRISPNKGVPSKRKGLTYEEIFKDNLEKLNSIKQRQRIGAATRDNSNRGRRCSDGKTIFPSIKEMAIFHNINISTLRYRMKKDNTTQFRFV